MGIFEENMFGITCNNCGALYEDINGSSLWDSEEGVIKDAQEDGWLVENGKCYCEDCWNEFEELETPKKMLKNGWGKDFNKQPK